MNIIKLIDQVLCAHWFWKKHSEQTIVCTMCGKMKPISKLKSKEKLFTDWWADTR